MSLKLTKKKPKPIISDSEEDEYESAEENATYQVSGAESFKEVVPPSLEGILPEDPMERQKQFVSCLPAVAL